MKKLNLGCGTDYMDGWVNIDNGNTRCDVKHDIEEFPLPFEDSSVDEIKMQHILEHVSRDKFIPLIREIYRVCVNGAVINIISPYAGSDNYWTDPTHKLPLTTRTFDYFDNTKPLGVNGKIYGWDDIQINVGEAVKVPNEPNGPDVRYKLIIKK
jgi:SAM-dependent methyltransferase